MEGGVGVVAVWHLGRAERVSEERGAKQRAKRRGRAKLGCVVSLLISLVSSDPLSVKNKRLLLTKS